MKNNHAIPMLCIYCFRAIKKKFKCKSCFPGLTVFQKDFSHKLYISWFKFLPNLHHRVINFYLFKCQYRCAGPIFPMHALERFWITYDFKRHRKKSLLQIYYSGLHKPQFLIQQQLHRRWRETESQNTDILLYDYKLMVQKQ